MQQLGRVNRIKMSRNVPVAFNTFYVNIYIRILIALIF